MSDKAVSYISPNIIVIVPAETPTDALRTQIPPQEVPGDKKSKQKGSLNFKIPTLTSRTNTIDTYTSPLTDSYYTSNEITNGNIQDDPTWLYTPQTSVPFIDTNPAATFSGHEITTDYADKVSYLDNANEHLSSQPLNTSYIDPLIHAPSQDNSFEVASMVDANTSLIRTNLDNEMETFIKTCKQKQSKQTNCCHDSENEKVAAKPKENKVKRKTKEKQKKLVNKNKKPTKMVKKIDFNKLNRIEKLKIELSKVDRLLKERKMELKEKQSLMKQTLQQFKTKEITVKNEIKKSKVERYKLTKNKIAQKNQSIKERQTIKSEVVLVENKKANKALPRHNIKNIHQSTNNRIASKVIKPVVFSQHVKTDKTTKRNNKKENIENDKNTVNYSENVSTNEDNKIKEKIYQGSNKRKITDSNEQHSNNKLKKIELVINVVIKDSDGNTARDDEEDDHDDVDDMSFLDDINVDEIVQNLREVQNSLRGYDNDNSNKIMNEEIESKPGENLAQRTNEENSTDDFYDQILQVVNDQTISNDLSLGDEDTIIINPTDSLNIKDLSECLETLIDEQATVTKGDIIDLTDEEAKMKSCNLTQLSQNCEENKNSNADLDSTIEIQSYGIENEDNDCFIVNNISDTSGITKHVEVIDLTEIVDIEVVDIIQSNELNKENKHTKCSEDQQKQTKPDQKDDESSENINKTQAGVIKLASDSINPKNDETNITKCISTDALLAKIFDQVSKVTKESTEYNTENASNAKENINKLEQIHEQRKISEDNDQRKNNNITKNDTNIDIRNKKKATEISKENLPAVKHKELNVDAKENINKLEQIHEQRKITEDNDQRKNNNITKNDTNIDIRNKKKATEISKENLPAVKHKELNVDAKENINKLEQIHEQRKITEDNDQRKNNNITKNDTNIDIRNKKKATEISKENLPAVKHKELNVDAKENLNKLEQIHEQRKISEDNDQRKNNNITKNDTNIDIRNKKKATEISKENLPAVKHKELNVDAKENLNKLEQIHEQRKISEDNDQRKNNNITKNDTNIDIRNKKKSTEISKENLPAVKHKELNIDNKNRTLALTTSTEAEAPAQTSFSNEISIALQLCPKLCFLLKHSYRFVRIIHSGRFSTVYHFRTNKGLEMAAKLCRKKKYQMLGHIKHQMLREIQRDVPRMNLTCVYLINGMYFGNSWCYFMEYLPKNLNQALAESGRPFPLDTVLSLATQLVSAVLILRNNGVVHSNIKPHHILLNSTNTMLKLGGFGDAYYAEGLELRYINPCTGTLEYRAPEVIVGHGAGYGIDTWSTALVLYEMYTNQKYFNGSTNNEILYEQMTNFSAVPYDMLAKSQYRAAHFFKACFKKSKPTGNEIEMVPLKRFTGKPKLTRELFNAFFKHSFLNTTEFERKQEMKRIADFARLLMDMLVIHPKDRLPIELVYGHRLIYR